MKRVYFISAMTSILTVLFFFGIFHFFIRRPEVDALKIGFVYVGDSSTPYTDNFIEAQEVLENAYGDQIETVVLYNIPEDGCEPYFRQLVDQGCDVIFGNSFGYCFVCKELAAEFPQVQFCAATGIDANEEPVLSNYHNYMGSIYEGRYITGVVAGMKLKEEIEKGSYDAGHAKIGYVAAFPYAEVISGYTAFYLGVQSVVPEATMLVEYVDSWSNYSLEKKAAADLIKRGCVLISQHSDTYGPAVACENAKQDYTVYHVGYNQSMTEVAPKSSLISCGIDYSKYLLAAVSALINHQEIESTVDATVVGKDCFAGLAKGWVRILDVNEAIAAEGTREKIAETEAKLSRGDFLVFQGDFTGTNPDDETDTIDLRNGYVENETSSSPTFHYILDGVIKVIN